MLILQTSDTPVEAISKLVVQTAIIVHFVNTAKITTPGQILKMLEEYIRDIHKWIG